MKGTFAANQVSRKEGMAVHVMVKGNVGQENRDKLTALGMTPATDISNCREKYVFTREEFDALRAALIAQEII